MDSAQRVARSSGVMRHGRCHITYIGPPNTALYNGQNPLTMSNTNTMKQLRGPKLSKHENWPVVCDTRALALPGEYGL